MNPHKRDFAADIQHNKAVPNRITLSLRTDHHMLALLLIVSFVLTGCLETLKPKKIAQQKIVQSMPSGAECRINVRGHMMAFFYTPAEITVPPSWESYLIYCSKPGIGSVARLIPAHSPDQGVLILYLLPQPDAPSQISQTDSFTRHPTLLTNHANLMTTEPTLSVKPAPSALQYGVYLGNFPSRSAAQNAWSSLVRISQGRMHSKQAQLHDLIPTAQFDLYATDLTEPQAIDLCTQLNLQNQACQVVYF